MQSAPETIPAAGMDVPSTCMMVGYVTDTGNSSLENRLGFPNVQIQHINHFATQAQLFKSAQPNNGKNQRYI